MDQVLEAFQTGAGSMKLPGSLVPMHRMAWGPRLGSLTDRVLIRKG